MSFGSFLRGIAAQVNPFDNGKTYGSVNPPKKKLRPGDPGYVAPGPNVRQQPNFVQQSDNQDNTPQPQRPENLFQGLNQNLRIGASNPNVVPVVKTPDVQPTPTPQPGNVVKPSIPFWKRAVNDVGNVASAGAGAALGTMRAVEGLAGGIPEAANQLTHAINFVPRKVFGNDSAVNQKLSQANRDADSLTHTLNKPTDWLGKTTDQAASAYGPAARAVYKPVQIGANVAAVVPGAIEGGAKVASWLTKAEDLSKADGVLGALGRAKSFVDAQRFSPVLTSLDEKLGGLLSKVPGISRLIEQPKVVPSEPQTIPVQQNIPVSAPEDLGQSVNVRNLNEPPPLVQDVAGGAKTATSNADAANRAIQVRRVEAAKKADAVVRPDMSVEGITKPEPVFLGQAKGPTQIEIDTERKMLDDALANKEISKTEHTAANKALDETVPTDATPQTGQKIAVKDVTGIPVTDQTNIPTDLPEKPGTVRVTEATAPANAKAEAVAAQTPAPLPQEVQQVLDNPGSYNKRDVKAARGFVKTVAESKTPAAETAAGLTPKDYTPLTNDTSFNTGDNFINQHGVEAAHKLVTDENTPFDAVKSGMGQRLMQHYANTDETAKLSEVIDSVDRQARVSGQGNQMLANWDKLSPEAVFKLANNEAEKAGVTLTDDFKKQILQEMRDVHQLPQGSAERAAAMQGVLKDVAEQLPTTKKEWLQNYRYQNMLSSPISAEKIGTSGVFNTLVTHPVDLFSTAAIDTLHKGASIISHTPYDRTVAFSDIPTYYKNVLQGLPDAWHAAVESFRTGNLDKTFEEGKSGSSTIAQLRQQNIPAALRPFSSLHGSIYHFFQSLISGGEKARLMEHGMSEAEAAQKAAELGDKLTLRSPLGTGDGSPAVRAVDAIGKLVSDVSKKDNALGATMKWVAPFMKVSTNWAKLAVEHSPLALIDNPAAMTAEQVGKAFTGSVATGIGLTYTMRGDVTLGPPTDSKEQELWYASGRKPYSVKIGGKWVDMRYLGPFAITFALPQAVKDATSGTNASKGTLTKIEKTVQNITQDIVSSTPLPSVAGFFNFLNGDSSVNPDKLLADLASQAIPLEALQRYIANAVDPIYRQSKTFTDRIKSGIPGMSKDLPAFTTPEGQPETRNASNFVAPYPISVDNPNYNDSLKAREDKLAADAAVNQANKDGSMKNGQKIADNIWQLPDGSFSYKIGNEYKAAKSQDEAQTAIAKEEFGKSGKSYQTIGDNVFRKDKKGNVTSTPKVVFDHDLNAATLISQKKSDNLTGWLDTAGKQLDNIQKQINDPNVDPIDRVKLQNEADSLFVDIAKYKDYGGFTKPKTGRGSGGGGKKQLDTSFGTLKGGSFAPSVQQYASIDTKSGSVPHISVQRPNIVHKITTG